jgi:DNA-binding CsgD family transcriptional regulator
VLPVLCLSVLTNKSLAQSLTPFCTQVFEANKNEINPEIPQIHWGAFALHFELDEKEIKLAQYLLENDFSVKKVSLIIFGSANAVSPKLSSLLSKTKSRTVEQFKKLLLGGYILDPTFFKDLDDKITDEEINEKMAPIIKSKAPKMALAPLDYEAEILKAPNFDWKSLTQSYDLNDKELKLIQLYVANKYSTRQVGQLMGQHYNTINNRLKESYEKLKIQDRNQLQALLQNNFLRDENNELIKHKEALEPVEPSPFLWARFNKIYNLSESDLNSLQFLAENDFSPQLVAQKKFRTSPSVTAHIRGILEKAKIKNRIKLITILYKNYFDPKLRPRKTEFAVDDIIDWENLNKAYNFSQLDLDVLKALANGDSLTDYAKKSGRNVDRVNVQLSVNIYKKLNLNKHEDLIKFLYTQFRKEL